MDLILTRKLYASAGIFGKLRSVDETFIAQTLEHSFDLQPKVASGVYTCKRGMHRLHGMQQDFETFEVLDVPPFRGSPVSGILFHVGNFNRDSEGCILVGRGLGIDMLTGSRAEFEALMELQAGLDSFQLTILDSV